jgi:hypothetical protein
MLANPIYVSPERLGQLRKRTSFAISAMVPMVDGAIFSETFLHPTMRFSIIFKGAIITVGIPMLIILVTARFLGLWYDVNWTVQDANRILQTEVLTNNVIAKGLVKPIPPDEALATRADGDSFLGTSFVPRRAYSTLRLSVQVFVSADKSTEAVIAVFVNWQDRPLRVVSQAVTANECATIAFSLDVPTHGTYPNGFDFRIGPAKPGMLTLNGPGNSDQKVESTVLINEIGG